MKLFGDECTSHFQKRRHPFLRFRTICLLGLSVAVTQFFVGPTLAVQDIPKIVSLENGAQFEGRITSVGQYSEGLAETDPFGNKPIGMVDDGLRRILFCKKRYTALANSDRNEIKFEIWNKAFEAQTGFGTILRVGPFDKNGHRVLEYMDRLKNQRRRVIQGIVEVTPRYCVLKTLNIPNDQRVEPLKGWTMSIATSTVPPDVLRNVLIKEIDRTKKSDHLKIVDFFLQAEQYQRAIDELDIIQKRWVDIKDPLENNRISLQNAYARQVLREARFRVDSGQIKLGTELAKVWMDNKQGLSEALIAEYSDFQNEIKIKQSEVDTKRGAIATLVTGAINDGKLDPTQTDVAKRFQAEIESELRPSNVNRLDGFFVNLAGNASMPVNEKLSLAMSGWVLGGNSAISNFAVGQSLIRVRDLVVKYLQSKDKVERSRIINELETLEGSEPEYLAKIISNLTPVEPMDLSNYTGEKPLEFFVEVPGTRHEGEPQKFRCLAHLPPGYDPYRNYPCMLTLKPGIDLEEQLNRWCGLYNPKLGIRTGQSIRHGYVTVAVDWKRPDQTEYEFSAREHLIVLKALRKTLRSFAVDPDRVFLNGYSTSATAAYDIGIAHPEHWAGVIGVGGAMNKYVEHYKDNRFGDLPVYSVVGQKDLESIRDNKVTWNHWLDTDLFVDCVLVEYKGRANEAFFEEIPEILKWTDAIRRRWPDKSGFEVKCKILRPWDNYYWYCSISGLPLENMVLPQNWNGKENNSITLDVIMRAEQPNKIVFRGPENKGDVVTLWLSPEIVDFSQEIEVLGRKDFKGEVVPSREILLEDVRRRADRQHPYWAKLVTFKKDWKPSKVYDANPR